MEEVDCKNILGVIVDDRLNFIKHVDYVEKKCQKRLHWLRVLKRNGVGTTHLRNLYLTMIRSRLTYAAEAWHGYLSSTQKDRLERVQRTALKYILPDMAYDTARVQLNLPSIESFIHHLSIKLFKNIVNSGGDHRLHKRLPMKCFERATERRVTVTSLTLNCAAQNNTKSHFLLISYPNYNCVLLYFYVLLPL